MPFAYNQGAEIYWEEHGQGEPLVLVSGLGYTIGMWFRLLPELSKRYRTVLLDNRGVGRSSVPPGPYNVPLMASDVAAVMDAAGIGRAHLLGMSMGGMIAQEFALTHPQRAGSLVLCCTSCGGFFAAIAPPHVFGLLFTRASLGPEGSARALVPYTYDPSTPPERVEEDIARRLLDYPTRDGYMSALRGLMFWTSYPRLGRLRPRTLVLHGESDVLVPPRNAKILGDAIPGAEVVMLSNASHALFTDQTEASLRAIVGFLDRSGGLGLAAALGEASVQG